MDKRTFHHAYTVIRPIRPWYLVGACVVTGTVAVLALRSNYSTMTDLRAVVYEADQTGGDVEGALQALRYHVNQHMNTNLAQENGAVYPPIQLKYTYERLTKAEQERVNRVNSEVYTDAQHYCEQLYPGSFSGGPRVPCIEQYVKEHGTKAQPIPADLYRFSFATPRWSPDLAGWSLALSALFAALVTLRVILGKVLKSLSK